MSHVLPALPYSNDALTPFVSAETLRIHHGKHHRGYVDRLNELLAGHKLADVGVEDLIRRIEEIDAAHRQDVFNAAAQHFNHSFYWKSLRPASPGGPGRALLAAVNKWFGSLESFKDAFTEESVRHFGSGWGWLVKDADGRLRVMSTHDAGTPSTTGAKPILACDVWEHAYYVDYRNDRAAYLRNFWAIADWDFADRNFQA